MENLNFEIKFKIEDKKFKFKLKTQKLMKKNFKN
jgi:hypothetical protein